MKEQEFFFNACVNTEGPALRTLVLPEPGARPSVPASFLSTSCKRPLFQIQSLFPHLNRGLSFLRDPGSGEEALYSPYHSQVWTEAEAIEDTKRDNFPAKEQITTAWRSGWQLTECGLVLKARGLWSVFLTTALLLLTGLHYLHPLCYFLLSPTYLHGFAVVAVMMSEVCPWHFEHIRRQKHWYIQEITWYGFMIIF